MRECITAVYWSYITNYFYSFYSYEEELIYINVLKAKFNKHGYSHLFKNNYK